MGFLFAAKNNKVNKQERKTLSIPINTARALGCKVCPLYKTDALCKDMPPSGIDDPIIYILGEAPGRTEDERGEPFVGKSGQFLREHFPGGYEEYVRFNNVVRTRPPENRNPELIEIESCRKSIEEDIIKTKPKIIVPLGKVALSWLNNGADNMLHWHGRLFSTKIKDYICLVYPMYHPSFIMRSMRDSKGNIRENEWSRLFKQEMDYLWSLVIENCIPTPKFTSKEEIKKGISFTQGLKSSKELEKVVGWIESCERKDVIAVDYETNAIKPYGSDKRLLTISIGTFEASYAFPYEYRNTLAWSEQQFKTIREKMSKLLADENVLKVAHNLNFEAEWTLVKFGLDVLKSGRWEDSMAQAYFINEQQGMLNLDVLVRLHFGFNLKEVSNLDRSKMESYALETILPYNALDVKWTYALYREQSKRIKGENPRFLWSYNEAARTSKTLATMQATGLEVDRKALQNFRTEFTTKIESCNAKIASLPEVKEFAKRQGTEFNPASPKHLLFVFEDILDMHNELLNDEGKKSTDESVLARLDSELAKLILESRGLEKKKGTYIDPIDAYLQNDGRIHTSYNLLITRTGRLSSSDPNMQNWPNRKGREIRKIVTAPEGFLMCCADYGQIEARLIAVASQDQRFMDVIWSDYDVHKDWAVRIAEEYPQIIGGRAKLSDDKAIAKFRKVVKNQWVFPAFYGSSIKSISRAMMIPQETLDPLFKRFWEEFKGIKKWQQWLVGFYNRHGYVETMTGRRRHGPLSYNKIINAPIQGLASDVCVNAMNRLIEKDVQVVMNVHDDITSYVPISDLKSQVMLIAETMATPPFPFINVPIAVELSLGPNWHEQEEIGTFKSVEFMKVSRKHLRLDDYQNMQW